MNLKKYEHLKWEYLNRSEDYKEFCEFMRKKTKNKKLPIPEKFKTDKPGIWHPVVYRFHEYLHLNYSSMTFDEWWKWREKNIKMNQKKSRPVVDYLESKFVEKEIQHCIDSFKRFEGREPTLDEFKKYFIQLMKGSGDLYLMVKPRNKSEDLVKKFREVVQDFKKNKLNLPKHRKRDELERYLKIYDLWKEKVKMKDIIKQIGTKSQKADCNNQNVIRVFRADLAKAKKIIKNVERGYFPGKY